VYVSADLGQAEDTAFSYANLARELVGSKELDGLASKVRELLGQTTKMIELEASLRKAYDGYLAAADKARAIPGAADALNSVKVQLDKGARRYGIALYVLDMTTLGLMNLGNKLSEAGLKNEADMTTMLRNQVFRLEKQAETDLNPRSGNTFSGGWTAARDAFFARAKSLGVDTRNQEDVRWWQALSGTGEDTEGLGIAPAVLKAIASIVAAIAAMVSVLALVYGAIRIYEAHAKASSKIVDMLDEAAAELKKIEGDQSLSASAKEEKRRAVENRVRENIGLLSSTPPPRSFPQIPWGVWVGAGVFGLAAIVLPLIARKARVSSSVAGVRRRAKRR